MIKDKSPKPNSPVLADKAIAVIQDALIQNMRWLNYAFPKAQRLVDTRDKRRFFYPAINIEGREYVSMFPDEQYSNFCFFTIDEPQKFVKWERGAYNTIKSTFSIIFWFNIESILDTEEYKGRRSEDIKAEILRVLANKCRFEGSDNMTIAAIYEKAESIYKGFSIDEIKTQFLMQPFAGLRIEGELTYSEQC